MATQELPLVLSFLGGSLSSSFADLCTFPMDMLKTRMQMGGTQGIEKFNSMRHCVVSTHSQYGFSGFYKGISASLIRQFSYSGIRVAIYDKIKAYMGGDMTSGNMLSRFLMGAFSGGTSSLICTPLDVVKIRLINDPYNLKYTGFQDALFKTHRKEGFFNGFYKGSSPNVYRAVLVNAAELGTYDNAKGFLIRKFALQEDSLITRFWASLMAGFVAAVVTSPVDVIKTRYMNDVGVYGSPLDCAVKIVKSDGPRALYNGFLFLWLRLGPWCVIMFMSWDYYKDVMGKHWSKDK